MKLYGIALALVPSKENAELIQVTCTPISVSSDNRDQYEVVDRLVSKHQFHWNNMDELFQCFAELSDQLEKVVKLQRKSCEDANIAYRKVAINAGEDSRRPVNFFALYSQLVGKDFADFDKDEVLEQLLYTTARGMKLLGPYTDANYNAFTAKELQEFVEYCKTTPGLKDYYEEVTSWMVRAKQEIAEAKDARASFVEAQGKLPAEFAATSEKVGKLLEECALSYGSYSKRGVVHWDDRTPSELDAHVAKCKQMLDQGGIPAFRAHAELLRTARNIGRDYGKKVTSDYHVFSLGIPKGYMESEELQRRFPSYSFYTWNPDYKAAFHRGFKETYRGPMNRRLKLPGDPEGPPFADPCADMIRDQLDVALGVREEGAALDHKRWRDKFRESAAEQMNTIRGV